MSSPKKFYFDVWLSQGKTVYRDVPYEVVTDWLQQGRLLGDDRIRPAKTEEWFLIDKVPAFSGFVPRADPLRTDEKAEALEPLESPFAWGPGHEEEEADPDMIPLIDVSLVLLIFFMMTSTVASVISAIAVPTVASSVVELDSQVQIIWVGINYISDTEPASYSINWLTESGDKGSENNLSRNDCIKRIDDVLSRQKVPEIRVAAHKSLNFGLIKDMGADLEKYKADGKVRIIRTELGEKQ
jgi:biopolymer transport protein ExbD